MLPTTLLLIKVLFMFDLYEVVNGLFNLAVKAAIVGAVGFSALFIYSCAELYFKGAL